MIETYFAIDPHQAVDDMIALIGIGFFIGWFLGLWVAASDAKQEAVEKGHAHYDPKTRKFTWGPMP